MAFSFELPLNVLLVSFGLGILSKKGEFFLGHDEPENLINYEFIQKKNLWFHAKNIEAFHELLKLKVICLWHQNDDVTLTSKGYIWAYPGKQPIKSSIAVLPEIHNDDTTHAIGICSDNIKKYK